MIVKENIFANSGKAKNERIDKAVLKVAFILIVGALAPLFDTTIMNIALNALEQDLHASISTIQWLMTSFLLTMGMVIPVTGWATERFGGKRVWLLALILFLTGSVLAGLSRNVSELIAFRVVQGIGAGMMVPVMMTIIVQTAGRRKLGKLMALISMPALLGPILGPVLGGFIINNLNWRWIFYVNVPICGAALILAWFGLPPANSTRGNQHLDLVGLSFLSPALVGLLFGLGEVDAKKGFADPIVGAPLALSALLLIAFIVYAKRMKSNSIIDLRLFHIRSFTSSSTLSFLSGAATFGAMLLLPLYYQQVREESALVTGLLLIPQGIGALLTRGWIGKLSDHIGPRWVVVFGNTIATIGTLPFSLAGPHTSQALLGAALVVRGAGLGGVTIPVMATAYQGLRREQIPHASSIIRIMQQVGGAFGAAAFAVILSNQLAGHLTSNITASAKAFDHTFWCAIGLSLCVYIPAFLLPGHTRESNK